MATAKAIESTRTSAKKAGGPRDTSRTRLNSITHGLRSPEVVIPGEDPAQFRAFLDAWVDDWQPTTMARLELVEQCAAAAWRRKRCLRVETNRVSRRINAKIAGWRSGQARRVQAALDGLRDDPRASVESLAADRAGIDAMLARWAEVARAAGADSWTDIERHYDLLHLHGHCAADDEVVALRDASWRLYLRNVPGMIEDDSPPPLDDDGEAAAVADLIRRIAEAKIAELRALRETRPDPMPAWRAQAEAEAFEPRPEDAPLLRYEAQLSREFHRSLADLTKLTRSGDDLVEVAEVIEEEAAEEANNPIDTSHSEKKSSAEKTGSLGADEAEAAAEAVAAVKSDGSTLPRAPRGRRGRRRTAARAPERPPAARSDR